MEHIIMTGFKPFNATHNPTIDVVEYFNGMKYGNHTVLTEILPVEFGYASSKLVKMMRRINPDVVLSLGLSGAGIDTSRQDLNIEERGINIVNAKNPDAKGFKPENQKIDPQGPQYRKVRDTGFSVDVVVHMAKEGVRARASDDAGKYVCNDLLYRTLADIDDYNLKCIYGFIHMPWLEQHRGQAFGVNWEEKATMPLPEVAEGINLIIEKTLGRL